MSRNTVIGVALVATLVGVVGGYRGGTGQWPFKKGEPAVVTGAQEAPAPRKVLYWKHPDGKPDYAPAQKKTDDGRDYQPVYEEEEAALPGTPAAVPKREGRGKLLYYRNPMGLADTSPTPKKDWMGMDYIPVYEGEEENASTVRVSLEKVQRAGVRSEAAKLRILARPVRAPGIAKPDERTLRSVSLRADGFIEKLYVNAPGQHVQTGDPMFVVYSPQMVSVQVDYRNAVKAPASDGRAEMGALQRLRNMALPEFVIEQLKKNSDARMLITWPAPVTGIVMQKNIVEGQMVKAGEELYRLADLSSIWVIADVPEQELALIKVGAPAQIAFRAYPGELFEGTVSFILHELDAATRTAKVRIEVKNPDHRIKHEMFADVTIDAGSGASARLAVPVSAVIDSGNRQVVIIDLGDGRFEPRAVKIGARGDGFVAILEGVKDGDQVVVAANFLIDAESNLKAALASFTADPPKMEVKP